MPAEETSRTPDPALAKRRPLFVRSAGWANAVSRALARAGVTANQVSIASVVGAAVSAACILATRETSGAADAGLLLVAAGGIAFRLTCNMLDGMIAVEYGGITKSGVVFNEVPDRLADILSLAASGYAVTDWDWAVEVGWLAAALAVMSAYIRALGGMQTGLEDFSGPFAKPLRGWLLVSALVASAVEVAIHDKTYVLGVALAVICLGTAVTIGRRTLRLVRRLEARE